MQSPWSPPLLAAPSIPVAVETSGIVRADVDGAIAGRAVVRAVVARSGILVAPDVRVRYYDARVVVERS